MSEVIAYINTETPTGRRIVSDLEKHTKTVRMEYPLPEADKEASYTHEEVWKRFEKKFNEHYGTDYKFDL